VAAVVVVALVAQVAQVALVVVAKELTLHLLPPLLVLLTRAAVVAEETVHMLRRLVVQGSCMFVGR
jgi:hypothetical protein